MTTIIDVKIYQPKADDVFIFDSNIWIDLFNNLPTLDVMDAKRVANYSEFLKRVLNANAVIYITALNIQELSKHFSAQERVAYESEHGKFEFSKQFRNTEAYKRALITIRDIIRKIVQKCCLLNDSFEEFDYSKFFNADIDFVDEYFGFLAKENNCMLVSHDKDLKNCPFDITILTDNSKLLK